MYMILTGREHGCICSFKKVDVKISECACALVHLKVIACFMAEWKLLFKYQNYSKVLLCSKYMSFFKVQLNLKKHW